jgi:triacylglycerol lipase
MTLCSLAQAAEPAAERNLRLPFRTVKDVEFARVNDVPLLTDIVSPDDDQVHPGVVMIHGGAWTSGDKWNMSDHARELAQAGYVAININYRLAPRSKYPSQLDDCRAALKWLQGVAEQYHVDLNHLAVYGYSAGGQLAAMLATDQQAGLPKIRAAVIGGAPCDLSFIPEESPAIAHVLGGTRKQIPGVYRDASPVNFASSDDCPMFFFHGDCDLIVPTNASKALCDKLNDLGVETCYYTVEKQGHLLTFIHPAARQAAIEFLNKHLRQGP